ncbi:GGDEF domain-containing protein [Brevibacillus fluminis]|uniref:GGDEF domain-containing protein n=1 Tax=Brevibacillus fluminis TaxID=511487 RepID=A0A3M8DR59_9BACL|nr:GGDEF domain-containing protein [Brevibacillus fluminis]RNB90620.1 GGDEF domain-containing protein [Brevibacillus fluminis]
MKLAHILTRDVHTITSDKSVKAAGEKMDAFKIGSLVVVEAEQVIGIITSRNVRTSHPNRLVADAMTTKLIAVSPDLSIFDAMNTMQRHEIERLVVMREGQLEGIVTRETVMASISMMLDPLTKLYRSPYITYITEQLLASGQPFWFLFVDMNDFGIVNKEFGHMVGDQVLTHFSEQLRQCALESDAICRFAGDEFIVLTTHSQEHAQRLVERLSQPFVCDQVIYSAAVAMYRHHSTFTSPSPTFRDILNRTSLQTSQMKKNAALAHHN